MSYKIIKEHFAEKNQIARLLKQCVFDFKLQNETNTKLEKLSNTIAMCSTHLETAECTHCKTEHYYSTLYCKSRLCPICAANRSHMYILRFMPILKDYLKKGKIINFLTLTIKDIDSLQYSIDKIEEAWRYMVNTDKFSRNIFNTLFIGGIRSIETKLGKNSKKWHTHFHLLVIKNKNKKDYYYIKSLWENATQRVFNTNEKVGSVHIETIHLNNKDKYKGFKADNNGNISDKTSEALGVAVLETMKYITKFDEFKTYSKERINELVNASYGKRFINLFGCMFGYENDLLKDNFDEEEINVVKCCKECCCSEFDYKIYLTKSIIGNNIDLPEFVKVESHKEKQLTTGYAKIRKDLVIGKKYGNVMFTLEHAILMNMNKYIKVNLKKGNYVFMKLLSNKLIKSQQSIINYSCVGNNVIIENNYLKTPNFREIMFSKEMFDELIPNLEDKSKCLECLEFPKNF